ncbi:MAG TPA: exodeoxyribonuclease VII small subunit [Verrucomicrobiae bacterium]|nr:exodeoxyribonuclease VII small subunit [Verrucomicrobiae bacterium]
MPNSTKSSESASGEKELAFEDALKKLENIVESMESGELPLEVLLTRFEEGTRLVKTCQSRLEEAELKISKLEKNRAGDFTLQPAGRVEEP